MTTISPRPTTPRMARCLPSLAMGLTRGTPAWFNSALVDVAVVRIKEVLRFLSELSAIRGVRGCH